MWSSTWVGERLQAEGVINYAQLQSALSNMKLHDERMEEALLRIGAIDEVGLLRFVAEKTRTQYVSTAKLARLDVKETALAKVPERTAEKLLTFPVRYDSQTDTLTAVSPDAGIPEHVKQIAIATGVKNLRVYFARPASVEAAIAKWYRGQIQSFAGLDLDTFTQLQSTVDMYERHVLEEGGLKTKDSGSAPTHEHLLTPPPLEASRPPSVSPPPPPSSPSVVTAAPDAVATTPVPPHLSPDRRLLDLAEMLNVMVALNENARDEFRGHSASVARFGRMMTERMGLDEMKQIEITIAANLHDVGKTVAYHLTALNAAQYGTHRTAAEKLVLTPVRLLESVGLPAGSTRAVSMMYERFDGQGFPGRFAGKDIPLGARILTLCDTYSDLTLNPRNPYRRALSHTEALGVLRQLQDSLFDPDLVELLGHLVAGEDLRKKLSDSDLVVLLVEPNLDEATLIELRLVAQGFEVLLARTAEQALERVREGRVRYVLSEVELQPFDGFELLRALRDNETTRDVPFFFVARASDTASIDRGFSLGAQDYIVKPTSGDVLAGKLRRLSAAAPRARREMSAGVAGSLSEMGLPDLVQILGAGRKSGRLELSSGEHAGEVHFKDGSIVHATFDDTLQGDDAFFELLALSSGSFELDPAYLPTEMTIQANAESLILEGLRRLDERNR